MCGLTVVGKIGRKNGWKSSNDFMFKDNKFICDDCGEEFHVSDEADNGVCDWCWMVAGA